MVKKYYIVTDEVQDGGVNPNYIPMKIVNFAPLIIGPPLIKLTPAFTYNNRAIKISVTSPRVSFNIYVPYWMLRSLLNDIYKYRNMSNIGPVQFVLSTPTVTHTMRTDYKSLINIIGTIKNNYKDKPLFEDENGKRLDMVTLITKIKQSLDKLLLNYTGTNITRSPSSNNSYYQQINL